MPITNLNVTDVGPFDEITLEFDKQVNVFTGPNNSGKSTLLWVLGELLVYPFTMPKKLFKSPNPKWRLSISTPVGNESVDGTLPADSKQFVPIYEKIGYTCYVPAQRQGTSFRSTGPTLRQDIEGTVDEALELFSPEWSAILRELGPDSVRQALWRLVSDKKEPELAKRSTLMLAGNSLVSDKAVKQKIVNLDYAASRKSNPAIKAVVNQVASIASDITEGFPIQFKRVADDLEGLYPEFGTPDGDLPLDVLSQGTQSIIQFLARLLFGYAEYYAFPADLKEKPGILIIDEIDAHLHPSWQRRIIPTLTQHFPNLQIFCSTHSPLMLAGLKEGQMQLLRRDENGKVTVSANTADIAGWTADEILNEFMEVPNPTDHGTAKRLSDLDVLTSKQDLSDAEIEKLKTLRRDVHEDLLKGPDSEQVQQFAEELKRIGDESTHQVPRSTGDQEGSRD